MSGETVRTEGICLAIRPWSRTSHVVTWLTPAGRIATVVRGAVRPKSFFLGQYDLNYTCDIVYYANGSGEVRALRECAPLADREALRGDYRALALADYFRRLAGELAPTGPDCAEWQDELAAALDRLVAAACGGLRGGEWLWQLLVFELATLRLLGLAPELEAESGEFALRGERRLPVAPKVLEMLRLVARKANLPEISHALLLDCVRVLGVYYTFHVDCASEARRLIVGMISPNKEG